MDLTVLGGPVRGTQRLLVHLADGGHGQNVDDVDALWGVQRALALDHVREMDFTGRPAKNMIFVEPAGLDGPALERWVTAAADYVRTLACS